MKKMLFKLISCALCVVLATSVTACKQQAPSNSNPPQEQPVYTLSLKENSKEMFVGETYRLSVSKYDENLSPQIIEEITFDSDNPNVASVTNGEITAHAVGETYINVYADGLESACFIQVKEGKRGQSFEIKFSDDVLYKNVPVQAYVYVIKDGVNVGIVNDVTFTAQESDVLSIDTNGIVTALQETDSTVIKASGSYNGTVIDIEKTIKVVPPFVYMASDFDVVLASTKTYSGKVNNKFIKTYLNIVEFNAITGERSFVDKDRISLEFNSDLATFEMVGNNLTFTANPDKTGSIKVVVNIDDGKSTAFFNLSIFQAIDSIEDMDKLALASYNSPSDLEKNYILVNDINYENQAIYPIANFVEKGSKTMAGYQYKYALDVDENGVYSAVDRENVGKDGYGLTDEEFVLFAQNWSGPSNKPFSGVFDGNGFAIKNALLMYGSNMGGNETEGYFTKDMGVFGHVDGATIRNVELNLSIQNPNDFVGSISKVYDSRVNTVNSIDCVLRTNSSSLYTYNGASVFARAYNSTIENVALNMSYAGFGRMSTDGAFVNQGKNLNIKNTAVDVTLQITTGVTRAMISAFSAPLGSIENNLVIGVNAIVSTLQEGKSGENGNWFIRTRSWKSLFSASAGKSASNVIKLANVIASYDTDIWDMTLCNKTDGGAPKLINGCSVPQLITE